MMSPARSPLRPRPFLLCLLLAGMVLLPLLARADKPLEVVASFSILGDMVRQVGGERIALTTLVGPSGDAHVYQPSPADARAVARAGLVVINGLGFDGWMERLIGAAGYKGVVIAVSQGIEPLPMEEEEDEHETSGDDHHDGDHHHGRWDPHAWQSLGNARLYVENIARALSAADPAGAGTYRANAARYLGEIARVEEEIRRTVAGLPAERRRIVTSHDAFGYFAAAYGVEFLAPVGISTDAEASAGDVARLIRQIKEKRITAVFVENISDPRLLDRIASETGARIGGTLFSDALSGADGPASTYLDMMRHNIRTLAAALGA